MKLTDVQSSRGFMVQIESIHDGFKALEQDWLDMWEYHDLLKVIFELEDISKNRDINNNNGLTKIEDAINKLNIELREEIKKDWNFYKENRELISHLGLEDRIKCCTYYGVYTNLKEFLNSSVKKVADGEALSKELAKALMKIIGLDRNIIKQFDNWKLCKSHMYEDNVVDMVQCDIKDMEILNELDLMDLLVYHAISRDMLDNGEKFGTITTYLYVPKNVLLRVVDQSGMITNNGVWEFIEEILGTALNEGVEGYEVVTTTKHLGRINVKTFNGNTIRIS